MEDSNMKKPKFMDIVMAEHVAMPGFPQLIVTRNFCYQWLKLRGWKEAGRGFDNLDYIVFARKWTDVPLTPENERDHYLKQVEQDYSR
jgi:hypothetical protein